MLEKVLEKFNDFLEPYLYTPRDLCDFCGTPPENLSLEIIP